MAELKKSVGFWAACIGAGGLIAAAVIQWGCPALINYYYRESREVEVTDVVVANKQNKIGVDVVLWNTSSQPHALTSISVRWSRREPSMPFPFAANIAPAKIYLLQPRIEVSNKRTSVAGTSSAPGQQHAAGGIVYLVDGKLGVFGPDSWSLGFSFPIREDLPPGEHISLIILVPEKIPIVGIHGKPELVALEDFLSGNPPSELQFSKLLRGVGSTEVSVEATYAGNRKAIITKSVSF